MGFFWSLVNFSSACEKIRMFTILNGIEWIIDITTDIVLMKRQTAENVYLTKITRHP